MASSQAPVNADDVANAFVKRYYDVLKAAPAMLIRFFRDESTFLHGQEGDQTSVDHGIEAITKSIGAIDFFDSTFHVLRVDGQATVGGSFLVNVLGALHHANESRPFVQTFVLAPQEVGFYVHNYVFRSFREASAESKRGGKGKSKGAQKAEQAADAGVAQASPATSPAPEHKAPAAAPAAAPAHVSPAPAAAHEHNKAHTHEHKTHEAKPAAVAPAAPAPAAAAAPAPAAAHEHNKAHTHEHKTHEATPAAVAAAPAAAAAAPAAKGTFSYAAALAVPGKPAAAPVPKKAAPKPAAAPAEGGHKPAAASSPSNARKDGASALCIKNIPFGATEEQFLAEIAKHAKVKNVVMKKGFAFLDLESEEAVQKLLDQTVASPIMLNDRALIVERRLGDGPTPARKEGGGKPREGPKEGGRGGGRGGGAAGGPRPAK